MSKKVIVTGANGFLGSNLCKKLLEQGYKVSVLVRRNSDISELAHLNLEYHYGDILDLNSMILAFRNQDYVFHLAGLISYKKYDRERMHKVNVEGTYNVIEACKLNQVKKLINLSSVATVGSSFNKNILDETSPYTVTQLQIGYFETKKEAENLVIKAAKHNEIFAVCVNPSTIYGSADAKKGSRRNQVKVAKGIMPFYTSGGVNVVSVDDVTDGILLALEKGQSGERYIISGENITIKELFELIAQAAHVKAPSKQIPNFVLQIAGFFGDLFKKGISRDNANTATMFHWFKHDKATKELGYVPKHSARYAIQQSVNWMKENGYLK